MTHTHEDTMTHTPSTNDDMKSTNDDMKNTNDDMKNKQPIILCAGEKGRALVYGYVDQEPVRGEPVRLEQARMVIYFPSGGTFGLAAQGPPKGSRVTHAVAVTVETRWQEWLAVSSQAAEVFDGWA